MAEPVCTEIGVSASIGGKVQVVKFEYDENFFFSENRSYSIPEDWTEEQIAEFQLTKAQELYISIDETLATPTVERLMAQRDGLDGE